MSEYKDLHSELLKGEKEISDRLKKGIFEYKRYLLVGQKWYEKLKTDLYDIINNIFN